MQKTIKLMPDYGCYPLWYSPVYIASIGAGNRIMVRPLENLDKDEIGCINPESLPLSQITVARLMQWQYDFDRSLNQDYPPDTLLTEDEWKHFEDEGFALWQTLINELPDYQVVYHPLNESGVLIDPSHPDIRYVFDSEAYKTRK